MRDVPEGVDDPAFLPRERRSLASELIASIATLGEEKAARKLEEESQERDAWAEKCKRQREYEADTEDPRWWSVI
jgi:hypothetical protein